jgi:hypothetical protein
MVENAAPARFLVALIALPIAALDNGLGLASQIKWKKTPKAKDCLKTVSQFNQQP